ncbi:MAG TPA: MauE/DoxX family redox-associated membrane protein [Solirubrobacteraceae bacterium]|jgi:hypothetical protein|nr:MauE/DoxX family redox-associated membrane protein [Solirubrobacteraceae bacterium]
MDRRGPIFWVVAALGAAAITFAAVDAVPSAGFVARGVVAGVFALAGVAKLRDPAPLVRVLTGPRAGLGPAHPARQSITPAHVRALAVTELATAGALLAPAVSTAGAVAALALLAILTAGAIALLGREPETDCGCLGDRAPGLGAPPVRNGVLAGLAGALIVIGPAAAAPSARWIASAALAVLLAVAGSMRPRATPAGAPEPPASIPALWSRRRWIRAGVAGAAASALTVLDSGVALAVDTGSREIETEACTHCKCCETFFFLGIFFCTRYCCTGCVGFSGGGVVQTASGTAHASFFGNKLLVKHSRQSITSGALSWFDPSWQGGALSLQSAQITSYRRVPGTPVRELVGLASANGKGKHRFVLRVVDNGTPGSGKDTVQLTVDGLAAGGAGGSGATYAASGELSRGDATVSLSATAINTPPTSKGGSK